MPNINNKGVSIPIWLAGIIITVLVGYVGAAFNQQATTNEKMLEALNDLKSSIKLSEREYKYLNNEIEEGKKDKEKQENEIKELQAENKLQQLEINELKRHHR